MHEVIKFKTKSPDLVIDIYEMMNAHVSTNYFNIDTVEVGDKLQCTVTLTNNMTILERHLNMIRLEIEYAIEGCEDSFVYQSQ